MIQKFGAFLFGKQTFFIFCGYFLRRIALHRVSNVSFRKSSRFPAKPTDFVIARRAFSMPDAAILNGTRRHPGTKHGKACAMIYSHSLYDRAEVSVSLCGTDRNSRWPLGFLSFSVPVLRHGMPYLWLKDCHVATLLAMTQNRGVFVWKRMFCAICGHFLRSIALHRLSNVSFRKSFRFFSKTDRFCHCEEGIFNARRGNLKRDAIPMALRLPRRCAPRNDTKMVGFS